MRVVFRTDADRAIDIAAERLEKDPSDPVVLSNLHMVAESASAKALPMLTTIAKNSTNPNARKDAIFWISRSKAEKDVLVETLIGLLPNAADAESDAVTHGLSQINTEKAIAALSTIARDKAKTETARTNAIFWIGNSKVANRVALLEDIYKNAADSEKLRVQVAFALRQTREAQAVTVLGNIAKTDPSINVRRQAVFYLGEIRTPEAIRALEELLKK